MNAHVGSHRGREAIHEILKQVESLLREQLTLDIYDKGTILGDMRLLGQQAIPEAYAQTLDAAVICTITPDELRRLIERHPIIGVNIISHLSRRLQEAERDLEAMACEREGQRLARKLADLAQSPVSRRAGARTQVDTALRGATMAGVPEVLTTLEKLTPWRSICSTIPTPRRASSAS